MRARAIAGVLAGLALSLSGCDLPPICPEPESGAEFPPGCVELNEPPQGDIVVIPRGNDRVPIVDATVSFRASALDPDDDALYVEWDFDADGEFGEGGHYETPGLGDHVYRTSGRKQVTLRVTDFPGLPGGEGQFTDTVSVRVFSREEVENDHSPIASFTTTPNPALRDEVIRFDGSPSYDPDSDQQVTGYIWSFEDAAGEPVDSAFGANHPVYERSFATSGQYTARLQVTGEGPLYSPAFAETEQQFTILEHASPVAKLTATPNPALVEQRVEFDASDSTDADGDIASFEFDLDGNNSFETVTGGPTASRMYFAPGLVRPAVRVTDTQGNVDFASVDLHVEGPGGDSRHTRGRRGSGGGGARLELPFSARIEGDRFIGKLLNPPGRASKLEATARSLLNSRFSSRLRTTASGTGTVETKGVALARGKGRLSVCLKIALAEVPGSAATGGMRIVGGAGAGARLRGGATFRTAREDAGEIRVVGSLVIRRGSARGLPRRCARLAGR